MRGKLKRKRTMENMAEKLFTRCPLLYEDECVLVVDKPAGVLSHPNTSSGASENSARAPKAAFEGKYHFEERRFDTPAGPVWLMHRLDQEASGAILAVKSKDAADKARAFFDRNEIVRTYQALLSGIVLPHKGEWQDRLAEKKSPGIVRGFVVPHGKPNAVLNYALKRNIKHLKICLVEIRLITGKTHQIRIQAAHRKNPVCGDRVYGNFPLNRQLKERIGLRRLFLHASELGLPHPVSRKFLSVTSPLPEELNDCLKRAG